MSFLILLGDVKQKLFFKDSYLLALATAELYADFFYPVFLHKINLEGMVLKMFKIAVLIKQLVSLKFGILIKNNSNKSFIRYYSNSVLSIKFNIKANLCFYWNKFFCKIFINLTSFILNYNFKFQYLKFYLIVCNFYVSIFSER